MSRMRISCKVRVLGYFQLELPITERAVKIADRWSLEQNVELLMNRGRLRLYEFDFINYNQNGRMFYDWEEEYPIHAYPYMVVLSLKSDSVMEFEDALLYYDDNLEKQFLLTLGYLELPLILARDYDFVSFSIEKR